MINKYFEVKLRFVQLRIEVMESKECGNTIGYILLSRTIRNMIRSYYEEVV